MSTTPAEADLARRALAVEAWLVEEFARVLKVAPAEIDVNRAFPTYGISSRQEVLVAGDLEAWLGYELPPTVIWDYSTVHSLAWYIARSEAGPDDVP